MAAARNLYLSASVGPSQKGVGPNKNSTATDSSPLTPCAPLKYLISPVRRESPSAMEPVTPSAELAGTDPEPNIHGVPTAKR
eukprot:scaffold582826_cov43-Attheya_sp.AAC.1